MSGNGGLRLKKCNPANLDEENDHKNGHVEENQRYSTPCPRVS